MVVAKIRKRDGRVVNFDKDKITEAIWKAVQAVGGREKSQCTFLSDEVVKLVEMKFDGITPTVEDIQDMVEKVLIESGHAKVAKSYILYREQHRKMRDVKTMLLNVDDIVGEYIKNADWRIRENANVSYSFSGLFLHSAGSVMAYYVLNEVYPKEIAQAHVDGDFHLHDLYMSLAGYCAGWSLRQLLHEGFNGVEGKVESGSPKHLKTALGQMVNFLGTVQNEWAGAQAFSSFDTYLAPYVRKDNLSYQDVKQAIQEFVFSINVSSRWGGQTPFTNITLDWTVPEDMKDLPVIIGGEDTGTTYNEYQKEMDMVNKAFIEVMIAGDAKGRVFTFPIPTYNITRDFNWDSENSNLLFEMTAKYGLPYFQNFVNSDLKPSDVRSMCCRLQLNMKELKKKTGGLFGSGESTGSIGVVTINLPRIGYLSKTEEQVFEKLERIMYLAKEALEIKRKVVERNIENGLLPYTKRYLGNLNHHFSTIGLIGMNEMCTNFMGKDISTKEGKEFALKVLRFMREKLQEYQAETGNIYNLEATPGEGTSFRLAKIDKKKYPDIKTAGHNLPYYTNSSALPVGFTDDLFEALDHQEELQLMYTGGTVVHGFLGEMVSDADACKLLLKGVINNYRIPYFTITPTFSICKNHGYIRGEKIKCEQCGQKTEVYSRIVGYYRPVSQWNDGKQEEYKDRLEYDEDKSIEDNSQRKSKIAVPLHA